MTAGNLKAGAAVVNITPSDSQFLYGYPHVERYSTGVHDPLLSSALYLCDGMTQAMFITNDLVFVSKVMAERVRARITQETGIPAGNIMITATHTHSGPNTADHLCAEADPVVPNADPKYIALAEDGMVQAATQAVAAAAEAQVGLAVADATGIGTNRRDPAGAADLSVPVLMVRSTKDHKDIACMLVCSMHPTVLHEDSKLVSSDFPGMARQYLHKNVLGGNCVVLHHTGPAGNQSPRHVTKANTFAEAERLGAILGKAVADATGHIDFRSDMKLLCSQQFVELPPKHFCPVDQAEKLLAAAVAKLDTLRQSGAPRQETRTAECDWFGAEETLTLAKAAADGRLESVYRTCLPAEIQIIYVGPWAFVGWAGELFVEHPLSVKRQCQDTFVISLANGELQGYIVTKDAAEEGGYEASNSLFTYESGDIMVAKTLEMLNSMDRA